MPQNIIDTLNIHFFNVYIKVRKLQSNRLRIYEKNLHIDPQIGSNKHSNMQIWNGDQFDKKKTLELCM